MPAALAFCRLLLGDPAVAAEAADAAAPGVDRVDEIAGAWLACRPALERRRDTLAWGEVDPARSSVVAGLAELPDFERGAVAAQALGLDSGDLEQALGLDPGAAPGLLARAHARLAGLAQPADATCAAEREQLASAPSTGRPARTEHCDDCRAFATAVAVQRAALRRVAEQTPPETAGSGPREAAGEGPQGAEANPPMVAAGEPVRQPVDTGPREPASEPPRMPDAVTASAPAGSEPRRFEPGAEHEPAQTQSHRPVGARPLSNARSRGGTAASRLRAVASSGTLPPPLARVLEPEARAPRVAVRLAVVAVSGLAGFGVVSALETPRDGDSGVVTGTPVRPLPPGVGRTDP